MAAIREILMDECRRITAHLPQEVTHHLVDNETVARRAQDYVARGLTPHAAVKLSLMDELILAGAEQND